jgi:hypothetical protein
MNALIQIARNASPYLAVELLLPGGSLIALLLWLFRHRFKKGAGLLGMPEIGRRSRPCVHIRSGRVHSWLLLQTFPS